jgi:hypothetical protein
VADLKHNEKRDLEQFLEMRMGNVLGLSNRTLQQFVLDSTGLDIDDINIGGTGSKASRLRYFWENQPDHIVGKLLKDLAARRSSPSELRERCIGIAEMLLRSSPTATRRYYSARNRPGQLTLAELYLKLQHLYLFFRDRDYFKEIGITKTYIPDALKHKAALSLSFQIFPLTKWLRADVTEDHIFEAIEFLYDHVSRPGVWRQMSDDSGFQHSDYDGYDRVAGQAEFREQVNAFLQDYEAGFELTHEGTILAAGSDGLQHILHARIPRYDEINVDSKVRGAIVKWRNRHLSLDEKRAAIRDLADVFEWLKKTKKLDQTLDGKDESAIFDIANNFAIRHHNPKQKANYDQTIWYAWMFHFYLATYHAVIRLLIKNERNKSTGP